MYVKRISGGPLPTNCYILTDGQTGDTAVIDPGFIDNELIQSVSGGHVKMILLTHGHFDHITGVAQVKELTNAKIYIYSGEECMIPDNSLNLGGPFFGTSVKPFKADVLLKDGDVIALGKTKIKVIHTPGHTSGGCCYVAGDALFCGDTLMKMCCGRVDCPTGDLRQMEESLMKLKNLKGEYKVYPGHGPESSLDFERKNNPYMRDDTNDTVY